MGFQRTVPGKELLIDLYENWISPFEKTRLWSEYRLADYDYLAHQVGFLIRHFGVTPSAVKVFDFGLGWSEWASMAQAFGCDVSGSELSQSRIEHARERGIRILDWDEIASHRFHYINTEQVFEHLLSPSETLGHLAKALLPGGILKFSVPDAASALSKLAAGHRFASLSKQQRMAVHPLEHINCFEHSTILALARRFGLRPLRPSLRLMFDSSAGLFNPLCATRLLARTVYRHWYPKSTFVYLVRDDQSL